VNLGRSFVGSGNADILRVEEAAESHGRDLRSAAQMRNAPMTAGSDGQDVLRATVEKYATIASYSDTGQVSTRLAATGTVHRITFATLYQRPSLFRFTFFRPHPHPPLGQLVSEHAVGHDGTVGYCITRRPDGTVTRRSPISLGDAIARVTGISAGSAHTIGRLLLPEVQGQCLLDLQDAQRREDVVINGRSCHLIMAGGTGGHRQQEFWIEKDSWLLRKRITRSELGESVEERENIRVDSLQPSRLFAA
jgi:hypothetical protein